MRLVVTGASGFVGGELVPILLRRGAELLLVGRDPAALSRRFPGQRTCGYARLAAEAAGFDAVLHLAVLNNDVAAPEAEFMAVNVDLLLDVLVRARQAGVHRFVNVSTTHALDQSRTDPYSASKREAATRLRAEDGVTTLYLPLLYGQRWGGRLARLNRLRRPLAKLLFLGLACLKPVAHVERVAEQVLDEGPGEPELIVSDGQGRNPLFQAARRAVDLAFALAVLLVFWWGLLAIWAVVRVQSRGGGIFAQRRVGRDGVTFTCFKFRTMATGTVELGTHEVSQDAVTPIGRFLRRTKLDELPQVVNLLRGDMTLVGPRPCLPVQTELVAARRRRGVFGVTPGITGLAQAGGIDMSEPETLARWDSHYAAMQTLPLDARIALATLSRRGRGGSNPVPGRAGTPTRLERSTTERNRCPKVNQR